MQNNHIAGAIASGLGCLIAFVVLADEPKPAAAPSDATLIKSAESAAPRSVSGKATVIAMDAAGKMRTIRKGTNGWTCMPDNPATPGPDPMCWDKNAGEWVDAWMAHKTPPAKVGFMYMLAGGTDASNTDPYAQKPTAAHHDRRCRRDFLFHLSERHRSGYESALRNVGLHAVSAPYGAREVAQTGSGGAPAPRMSGDGRR